MQRPFAAQQYYRRSGTSRPSQSPWERSRSPPRHRSPPKASRSPDKSSRSPTRQHPGASITLVQPDRAHASAALPQHLLSYDEAKEAEGCRFASTVLVADAAAQLEGFVQLASAGGHVQRAPRCRSAGVLHQQLCTLAASMMQ